MSNTDPHSPSYSTGTTPTVPKFRVGLTFWLAMVHPGRRVGCLVVARMDVFFLVSTGSESGEMCAIKEMTLI
ncbi:putative mitogen-activated protein kinase kinase kinase [Helianthus anomalus]